MRGCGNLVKLESFADYLMGKTMKMDDLLRSRRMQSLEQLENEEWGPPTVDSYLASTCHMLRKKPIGEFSTEDLRIMIGQNIGTMFLIPLALEKLADNPLAESHYYPGDLLSSVLTLPNSFWKLHSDYHAQLDNILSQLPEIPEELAPKIAAYKTDNLPKSL